MRMANNHSLLEVSKLTLTVNKKPRHTGLTQDYLKSFGMKSTAAAAMTGEVHLCLPARTSQSVDCRSHL